VARSRGDQHGPGVPRGVEGRRLQATPLSTCAVALIVQRYARRSGLDATQFAAHSLRSGFITSAAESGPSILKMAEVSRHKSVDTLRGYVRRAELFHEHAGAAFL
jgi:site-specific recombinase XerD